jgi:hypothetical protein
LLIVGFVFLWGMVNYSSFARQRTEIQANTAEKSHLLLKRSEIYQKLALVLQIHGLALPAELEKRVTQTDQFVSRAQVGREMNQLEALEEQNRELAVNPDWTASINDLQENTVQLFRLQNRQQSVLEHYNRQTRAMPTRLVAKVFGFQPM